MSNAAAANQTETKTKPNRRIVKVDDERPARPDGTCFYCRSPIGGLHRRKCVAWRKTFLVEINGDFEVEYDAPKSWIVGDLVDYFEGSGLQCLLSKIEEAGRRERRGKSCMLTSVRLAPADKAEADQ